MKVEERLLGIGRRRVTDNLMDTQFLVGVMKKFWK